MCWASAPGCSPAIVATTWRGRSEDSSAHSATAPRERSQPSRAARRSDLVAARGRRARAAPPGRSRAGSARPPAAPPRPRPRSGRRPRRRAGTPSASATGSSLAEQQHGAELLVARGDRHLGHHARRAPRRRGRAPARPRSGAAPRSSAHRARTRPPRPGAGRRSPPTPPVSPAASAATPSSPSPPSTASTIRRCTARSRSITVAPRSSRLGLHRHVQYASFTRGAAVVSRPAQSAVWPECR